MGRERLSVNQAADRLGITPDAVRGRIKRGTLQAVRENGVVVVLLDAQPAADQSSDQPHNQVLVDALEARVESLERALDAEREANRENRRIIMQQAQNLSALEAGEHSESSPESTHSASEAFSGPTPSTDEPAPHSATQRGLLARLRRWLG